MLSKNFRGGCTEHLRLAFFLLEIIWPLKHEYEIPTAASDLGADQVVIVSWKITRTSPLTMLLLPGTHEQV